MVVGTAGTEILGVREWRPGDGAGPPAPPAPPARTVFFPASRSDGPGTMITAADDAEVTIVTPGDFYRAGRLVPDAEVRSVGRLVEIAARQRERRNR